MLLIHIFHIIPQEVRSFNVAESHCNLKSASNRLLRSIHIVPSLQKHSIHIVPSLQKHSFHIVPSLQKHSIHIVPSLQKHSTWDTMYCMLTHLLVFSYAVGVSGFKHCINSMNNMTDMLSSSINTVYSMWIFHNGGWINPSLIKLSYSGQSVSLWWWLTISSSRSIIFWCRAASVPSICCIH